MNFRFYRLIFCQCTAALANAALSFCSVTALVSRRVRQNLRHAGAQVFPDSGGEVAAGAAGFAAKK